MKLMIVESPNKAKTIGKYLGKDGIKVIGCAGHIRGLDTTIKNHGAIETENGFKQHFVMNPSNKQNTQEIIKLAEKAEVIYLATDLDNQGSAIAWHLKEVISKKHKGKVFKRVTFNQVNERSVKEAIENAGEIDMNSVEAQFALQALDYLVGFCLSPLLWKVVSRGTSAGRVQSPSLRLICEREEEIERFIPKTYWAINGESNKSNVVFPVRLVRVKDIALKNNHLTDEHFTKESVTEITDKIKGLMKSDEKLHVTSTNITKQSRKPKAPYITSSMQIDAIRKFGWTSSKVMSVAQKLFEGDGGEHGYITYHRTDSTSLSPEAIKAIFQFGHENFKEYMAEKEIIYKTKTKNAQEAHEAIRPSDVYFTPSQAKNKLDADGYRLYKMIWERTMASQMKPMVLDVTTVNMNYTKDYGFRTSGSVVVFKGYSIVYEEGTDLEDEKEENVRLPEINSGDKLPLNNVQLNELQTKPPARYNDASLVKTLEDLGIGRPSTYGIILKNLKDRLYVEVDNGRIRPTDLGKVIVQYLVAKFPLYLDYQFTSNLNEQLDKIADGELNWKQVMYDFWNPFNELVSKESAERSEGTGVLEHLSELCPKCGQANLKLMIGRYGKFKCCSRPKKECGYLEPLEKHAPKEYEVFQGKQCPKCNGRLFIKNGFKGRKFLSCEFYKAKEKPCDYTCNADGSEIVRKPKIDLGVKCPKCKKNHLFMRRTQRGMMISCGGFPRCQNLIKRDNYEEVTGKTMLELEDMFKQLE